MCQEGGGAIILPPLPLEVQNIWPPDPNIWTQIIPNGRLHQSFYFTTDDAIRNDNAHISVYFPNTLGYPPTVPDIELFTKAAIRFSTSRITKHFASILFWAQKQDTVNAALPYVQTILEQVRREYIQYYFTSIRDEINGGYFEGLKTAINEY